MTVAAVNAIRGILVVRRRNSDRNIDEETRGLTKIEQSLLDWLNANSDLAILLIPALAFLESCVGVGIFVSGVFLLAVATTLFTTEIASATTIVILAFGGALAGDHCGFYLGRVLGPRFKNSRIAQRHETKIIKANLLISRYGWAAIFIGRFVPAIRSLIPALLGVGNFPARKYSVLDSLACFFWACALGFIVIGLELGLG